MSNNTSPMTRSTGSVTPRRRGQDQLQRDEVEQLAAVTPVLLRLPDLVPNEMGITRTESPESLSQSDFTTSLPPMNAPTFAVGPEVNESPLPTWNNEAPERPTSPAMSDEDDEEFEGTTDSTTKEVPADWTEMGGRIFVGLLSILLGVAITWSAVNRDETEPNIDDRLNGSKAEVETPPTPEELKVTPSLAMEPFVETRTVGIGGIEQTADRIGTSTIDPYVTAASGALPANTADAHQDNAFTIHTLRPAADTASNYNQSSPSVRLGQPTEYPNDSFYR